jgi:hypothetical protein
MCPHEHFIQHGIMDARRYIWCADCGELLSSIEGSPGIAPLLSQTELLRLFSRPRQGKKDGVCPS